MSMINVHRLARRSARQRPQTPWEDHCRRNRFLTSPSSYLVLGLFLVALGLLIKA